MTATDLALDVRLHELHARLSSCVAEDADAFISGPSLTQALHLVRTLTIELIDIERVGIELGDIELIDEPQLVASGPPTDPAEAAEPMLCRDLLLGVELLGQALIAC